MIWELIKTNKRKSVALTLLMALVLLSLGGVIGYFYAGTIGLEYGLLIASGVFVVMSITSLSAGDQIVLASCKARQANRELYPQLYNVVEEMAIAAQLPKVPNVYVIPDSAPNSFATGRSPKSASIAVTAGLLARLNRDELQGVIAHEISHIIHRDILFITLAGIMVGAIVFISDVFLRTMFYSSLSGGSRRRYSSRSKNQGSAQLVMLAIAIIAAILAPIFAYVFYFSLSSPREYLATPRWKLLTKSQLPCISLPQKKEPRWLLQDLDTLTPRLKTGSKSS